MYTATLNKHVEVSVGDFSTKPADSAQKEKQMKSAKKKKKWEENKC